MKLIRILHASDLHIANIANLKSPVDRRTPSSFWQAFRYRNAATSYDPSLLKAFAHFVLTNPELDAILITGDIATTGDYVDLVKAHRFIKGEYSGAFFSPGPPGIFPEQSICESPVPIWILPGNHDRLEKRSAGLLDPGGVRFHEIFSEYWTGDVRSYPLLEEDDFAVAVVAADFSLRKAKDCGPWFLNKYAQGKVYDDILNQLVLQTASIQNNFWGRNLTIFWAIHFPPEFPRISPRMRLIDDSALVSAANKCNVKGILSGHTHERLKYSSGKMRFDVFCAGTVSEFRAKHHPHFQIISVTPENLAVEHYEFNRQFAEFRLVR